MGDLNISINGHQLQNVQLRQVKDKLNLEQAEVVLTAQKDGLDTIGVTIEDVDYLITGKGLDAKMGDTVMIEGQAAGQIAFVENEENTFVEGFKAGMKPVKGLEALEFSLMSPALPASRGLVRGSVAAIRGWTANDKVIEQVTQGPPIDKKLIEDAAKAISNLFGGGDD